MTHRKSTLSATWSVGFAWIHTAMPVRRCGEHVRGLEGVPVAVSQQYRADEENYSNT